MTDRSKKARSLEPSRKTPLSQGNHSQIEIGGRVNFQPVPPDPNYSESSGALQGNIPVDIHGSRIGRGPYNSNLLRGIERGLDEIVSKADGGDGGDARLLADLVATFQDAWANRRKDPDRFANLVAAWAVNGHSELSPDLNVKWRALFNWFIQEFAAKVARGVTPKERRENLRERVAQLPPEMPSEEAERVLHAEGWNTSARTIRRIRTDSE
jgi:hypothetical protein